MKHFLLKSIIVFFISLLVTISTGMIAPKTVYYYMSPSESKKEITEAAYKLLSKPAWTDSNNVLHDESRFVISEGKYLNRNAIIYGILTFAGLMIAGSVIELRKKVLL